MVGGRPSAISLLDRPIAECQLTGEQEATAAGPARGACDGSQVEIAAGRRSTISCPNA